MATISHNPDAKTKWVIRALTMVAQFIFPFPNRNSASAKRLQDPFVASALPLLPILLPGMTNQAVLDNDALPARWTLSLTGCSVQASGLTAGLRGGLMNIVPVPSRA